jgi:hypothetical protein
MSDTPKIPSERFSFRVISTIRAEVQRIAAREGNSESSVVRRLIERGLAAERPHARQDARTPPEAA